MIWLKYAAYFRHTIIQISHNSTQICFKCAKSVPRLSVKVTDEKMPLEAFFLFMFAHPISITNLGWSHLLPRVTYEKWVHLPLTKKSYSDMLSCHLATMNQGRLPGTWQDTAFILQNICPSSKIAKKKSMSKARQRWPEGYQYTVYAGIFSTINWKF